MDGMMVVTDDMHMHYMKHVLPVRLSKPDTSSDAFSHILRMGISNSYEQYVVYT